MLQKDVTLDSAGSERLPRFREFVSHNCRQGWVIGRTVFCSRMFGKGECFFNDFPQPELSGPWEHNVAEHFFWS